MDIKKIKSLAALLDESGLTAVEVKEGESTIRLERSAPASTVIASPQAYSHTMPLMSFPVDEHHASGAGTAQDLPKTGGIDFANLKEFKAPIIGVFFASPSPDAPAFVSVGDKVKKGDTLCIIEAMKVLNEIPADRDGEIIEILVENAAVVEYGQVLFKIL